MKHETRLELKFYWNWIYWEENCRREQESKEIFKEQKKRLWLFHCYQVANPPKTKDKNNKGW